MKYKKKQKDTRIEQVEQIEASNSCHYLNLPGRFITWLGKPGNLPQFQICLSIQSVLLVAVYSWWQSQIENYYWQENQN